MRRSWPRRRPAAAIFVTGGAVFRSDNGSMSTATVPSVYAFFSVMRTRPSSTRLDALLGDLWMQHVAQPRLAARGVQSARPRSGVPREPIERGAQRLVVGDRVRLGLRGYESYDSRPAVEGAKTTTMG